MHVILGYVRGYVRMKRVDRRRNVENHMNTYMLTRSISFILGGKTDQYDITCLSLIDQLAGSYTVFCIIVHSFFMAANCFPFLLQLMVSGACTHSGLPAPSRVMEDGGREAGSVITHPQVTEELIVQVQLSREKCVTHSRVLWVSSLNSSQPF